jgi:4-amino-4-deoxy-L-arabinose transferase-like glycosyltransferase
MVHERAFAVKAVASKPCRINVSGNGCSPSTVKAVGTAALGTRHAGTPVFPARERGLELIRPLRYEAIRMTERKRAYGWIREWWPGLVVAALALALRLTHVYLTATRNPLADRLVLDGATYDAWGRAVAFGGGPIPSRLMQAPLYPWFLAAIYKIFGPHLTAVRIVQALMGTATCFLVYAITKRLFRSGAAAFIAGMGTALYLPLVFYEGVLVPATLIVFLNLLFVALILFGGERPGYTRLAFAGLLLGLSIAAKPVAGLLFPFAVLHLTLAGGKGVFTTRIRAVLKPSLMLLAAAVIAILPVTIRNARITGEFIPVTTGLGINYYHGSNPEANGFYMTPSYNGTFIGSTPEEQIRSITEIASTEMGHDLSPSEVSRFWFGKGLEYNRGHPRRFLELLAAKALFFWNKHERANVENLSFHRELPGVLGLPLLTFGAVAPLSLLGIFLTRERARRLWLLYGGVITYFVAAVAFYVLARYRLPVVPFLLPFMGAGLVELYALLREGRRGEFLCMVVAFAALLYFVNMTAAIDTPTGRSSFFTRVGHAYVARGERDLAVESYRKAIRIDPQNETARGALDRITK